MAHKSMVGGTAYSITGGRSMVNGTVYNIAKGKTLVSGTGYDIAFGPPKTAMLYSDGNFVFQEGSEVEEGKTLTASYTDFENMDGMPPWDKQQNNFRKIYFNTKIAPTSIAFWFNHANSTNMTKNDFTNLNTDRITNMRGAFNYCYASSYFKYNAPVFCGNNVTDMSLAYCSCGNMIADPVCGEKVVNMYRTYYSCGNLSKNPVCGENVTNMVETYFSCWRLTGNPVCGSNVTNMYQTYHQCYNLTGSPKCGDNVIDMSYAYQFCNRITGQPACGKKVQNMYHAYSGCSNLNGSPVCGDNVTNMYRAYNNCIKLSGHPACGNNVIDMAYAYYNCSSLNGVAICGGKTKDLRYTYYNCPNLSGNAYFYSKVVNNVQRCFFGKNNSKQLNIYVPKGSTTQSKVLTTNTRSLVGFSITYTNANTYYYNTKYSIYIYPVDNVAAARAANGD